MQLTLYLQPTHFVLTLTWDPTHFDRMSAREELYSNTLTWLERSVDFFFSRPKFCRKYQNVKKSTFESVINDPFRTKSHYHNRSWHEGAGQPKHISSAWHEEKRVKSREVCFSMTARCVVLVTQSYEADVECVSVVVATRCWLCLSIRYFPPVEVNLSSFAIFL